MNVKKLLTAVAVGYGVVKGIKYGAKKLINFYKEKGRTGEFCIADSKMTVHYFNREAFANLTPDEIVGKNWKFTYFQKMAGFGDVALLDHTAVATEGRWSKDGFPRWEYNIHIATDGSLFIYTFDDIIPDILKDIIIKSEEHDYNDVEDINKIILDIQGTDNACIK